MNSDRPVTEASDAIHTTRLDERQVIGQIVTKLMIAVGVELVMASYHLQVQAFYNFACLLADGLDKPFLFFDVENSRPE